jgi:hypothetical protein
MPCQELLFAFFRPCVILTLLIPTILQEDTVMKKILVALLLAAVIGSGAFAQLMVGVSGALHMDQVLTAQEIKTAFDTGDGVFYGGLIEIAGKRLGVGVTMNVSNYERAMYVYVADPTAVDYGIGTTVDYVSNMKLTDYDLTLYLSYHLFGAHAFLDPFGEFGGGVLATGFKNDADVTRYNPYEGSFFSASYYWYGALGLGVSLGPIGVFGKFSYNYPLKEKFQDTFKGDTTGTKQDLYPFGYDEVLYPDGYLPKFRFTAGVKLIL